MNQSDSDGSQGESQSKDIGRLHAIWKNIKQAKKNKNAQTGQKSLGSVKQAIHQQQQKNLQTRLAMTEKQLSKSRQNTTLLMKKLSEAEQEIQYLTFQLDKQRKDKQERINQVEQLQYQLIQHKKFNCYVEDRQNEEILNHQIENLKKNLQFKTRELDRVNLKIKSLEFQNNNQIKLINDLKEMNLAYQSQISQNEKEIDQMCMGQSKGTYLLQLDDALTTINRLFYIIKKTGYCQELANLAEDNEELHFLKNIPKRFKLNNLNHQIPERKKLCSCMDVKIDERLLWTPASSYKVMLEMKMKYDSLTQDCIEQVLFELNKIMLGQQENKIRRVKQAYEEEIAKLKKKGLLKYDEMVARKQIQRLKKELHGAKNYKKPLSINVESLKNVGQYQDQLRLKQKEIKFLSQRIKMLQRQAKNNDKIIYMEGALWIIDKTIAEIQNNEQDLRDFQMKFRDQIQDGLTTQQWNRLYKYFFENITQIQKVLMDKLYLMKQTTIKKLGNQKPNQKQSILLQNTKY